MIFSRRSLPAAGALNHNPPQSAQCEPKRNAQTSLALHFDEGKGLAAKRLLFGSRRRACFLKGAFMLIFQ
jgi:hypothetical protein